MTKKILRMEYDYSFSLIGISSNAKDYRLCWHINKVQCYEFSRKDDIILESDFLEELYFSKFRAYIPHLDVELFLVSNKSGANLLIPESKESDFFLLGTEELPKAEFQELLRALNSIESVQTAYAIDPATLKSRDNLMFF